MTINTNITELEAAMLKDIITDTGYNFDRLDTSLPWEEQRLESAYGYEGLVETKARAKRCGVTVNVAKGVLGSLQKKGLIEISHDDPTDWIFIDEKQFNAIKVALAN